MQQLTHSRQNKRIALRGVTMLIVTIAYGIVWGVCHFDKSVWFSYIGVMITMQLASFVAGVVHGVTHDKWY